MLAESVLDRLVNNAHHVLMEGQSYRAMHRPGQGGIGLVAVVLGTLLGGWLQARHSRNQARLEHERQLGVLTETHRQNLEVLALQQRREEDLRVRQFAESDRADRLVVTEYVALLLPRLIEGASTLRPISRRGWCAYLSEVDLGTIVGQAPADAVPARREAPFSGGFGIAPLNSALADSV